MGSSARKKKDKKKDFQKPKLKVGKTAPKASNFTDTSFRAKSIVLSQQSLTTSAPSASAQFSQQLSLVTSKSDSQRRDAVAYLTNTISERRAGEDLPLPVATILPKVQPLILDGSKSVRENLVKLLRSLPGAEVASQIDQLLLYVRAGMTHLAADIRSSSLDVLELLLQVGDEELVSCAGGWLKTLNCFMSLLGWQNVEKQGKWSSHRVASGKPGSESKPLVRQLSVLAVFLEAGFRQEHDGNRGAKEAAQMFPVSGREPLMLYTRSNPFRSLNLFGAPRDAESNMYDDAEARKRAFEEQALAAVLRGISEAKKEGGEVGRAAAGVEKVLVMGDFGRET
ncbi:hypothetical protein MBLNU459_g2972t1 [Dothideomycetes sp. NU459]